MRIKGGLVLTIVWLILFYDFLPAQTSTNDINANNDSIRVLLFDDLSVFDISIGAHNSAINFSWQGNHQHLSAEDNNIRVTTNREEPDSLIFHINENQNKGGL